MFLADRCRGRGKSLLVEVSMGDENVIDLGDIIDSNVFWQSQRSVQPSVEEYRDTLASEAITGRS